MKQPTRKRLARIARGLMAWSETHHPETGAQVRGPVWTGPKPRTLGRATGYTPANAEANRAIDERNLGFGITPGSGLANMLGRVPRAERRLLLAVIQRKPGARRQREERTLRRRLAARGIVG